MVRRLRRLDGFFSGQTCREPFAQALTLNRTFICAIRRAGPAPTEVCSSRSFKLPEHLTAAVRRRAAEQRVEREQREAREAELGERADRLEELSPEEREALLGEVSALYGPYAPETFALSDRVRELEVSTEAETAGEEQAA